MAGIKLAYYIKERHNPQIGIYYKAMGRLTKKQARAQETPIYGYNLMLRYETLAEYNKALLSFGLEEAKEEGLA